MPVNIAAFHALQVISRRTSAEMAMRVERINVGLTLIPCGRSRHKRMDANSEG